MNPVKGQFTEAMMQRTLMHGFFDGTHWASATPARIGNQGIDGIFFRTDSNGNLNSMMVAEAKYGTSRLGQTASGKQMSEGWTRPRLQRSAHNYGKLASSLRSGGAIRSLQPPPRGVEVTQLPWKNGESIQVWEVRGRVVFRSLDRSVQPADLLRQTRRATQYLDGAARGRIEYRSRLFTTSVRNNRITITIKELDRVTGDVVGRVQPVKIIPEMFKSMGRSVEEALKKHGFHPADARTISEKVLRDPDFINEMNRNPRWNPRAGLQWQNFASAGLIGLISFLILTFSQRWHGQQVTWVRNTGTALLASGGAILGGWAGTQLAVVLRITVVGQRLLSVLPLRAMGALRVASSLGGVAGGLVATAAVSYILAAFGLTDWKTAHRSMIGGGIGTLVGAGAAWGTFSAFAAWGTASTGTAISTLSGAAATNATLAAIGGSVAWGSAALTGGATVIIIAVGFGVQQWFNHLDAQERERLLLGRIGIVTSRVADGAQPEWGTK